MSTAHKFDSKDYLGAGIKVKKKLEVWNE